jgi:Lon-like protease
MIALTVYDLFAEEDLLAGRTVHGTGSIDADGRVLPVGGVPEKMRAAADAGADVVLVPGLLIDEALAAAPDDLEVVGVDTFDEALSALRGTD